METLLDKYTKAHDEANQLRLTIEQFEKQIAAARESLREHERQEDKYKNLILASLESKVDITLNGNQKKDDEPISIEDIEHTSNPEKAEFVLSDIGHCLSSLEIVDEIINRFPFVLEKTTRDQYRATVSSQLYQRVQRGIKFNRYRFRKKSAWLFGLKDWFEYGVNGEVLGIKSEYNRRKKTSDIFQS